MFESIIIRPNREFPNGLILSGKVNWVSPCLWI